MREPRMTIAQLRWREVERLATIKSENPTDDDIREAAKTMNSLYRLVGLSERNFYRSNDERHYSSDGLRKILEEEEEREYRWRKRLEQTFTDVYGLKLMFPGLYPKIINERSGTRYAEINLYFYD